LTRDSRDPDNTYIQLILEKRESPEEIDIYTDGSRIIGKDKECLVGCAIYILKLNIIHKLKLNDLTSSYMVEVYALDLIKLHTWPQINVCTDSLSLLQSLENSQLSLFSILVAEFIYKINKINCNEHKVRFSWCPTHVGIKQWKSRFTRAKEAAIGGEFYNNNITSREIITSLKLDYANIDNQLLIKEDIRMGRYYLNNFNEIIFKFLRKITTNKKYCKTLNSYRLFIHKSIFV